MTETQEKPRDPAAVTAVGFFGIVYPQHNFWCGLYLHQGWIDDAPEFIKPLRTMLIDRSANASGPIPAELAISSITIDPIANVAQEDQSIAGNLLSMIVDCAILKHGQDRKQALSRVYAAAGAFSMLAGEKFFIIKAEERRTGTNTKLDFVSRAEIGMAQVLMEKPPEVYMEEKLRRMPEVQAIEAFHAAKRAKMS